MAIKNEIEFPLLLPFLVVIFVQLLHKRAAYSYNTHMHSQKQNELSERVHVITVKRNKSEFK